MVQFELLGYVIGLNMMKNGIDTSLWPYFSIAMYDEMKKVCIGCENIPQGEHEDVYQFACDCMSEHALLCPLSKFLVHNLVEEFGFVTAHILSDQ